MTKEVSKLTEIYPSILLQIESSLNVKIALHLSAIVLHWVAHPISNEVKFAFVQPKNSGL